MSNNSFNAGLLIILLWAAHPASAVEPPSAVIPLFNEDQQVELSGIDISATNPGIETVGASDGFQVSPYPPDPVRLRSRLRLRIQINRSSDNMSHASILPFVFTRPYPDPATATNTSYFCEDDGAERFADPENEPYPCDFDVNVGIATAGQQRFLVASLATYAGYENQTTGFVDIGAASVEAFDPETGQSLWRRIFNVFSGVWQLEDALSAVGDFLNGDGNDELRVVFARELSSGSIEWRYLYYNIVNGNFIKEDRFRVPPS